MSAEETPKRRPTLGDQLERQHEMLMAALAKTAPKGSESVSVKDVTIGDLKGTTVIENLTLVRGDGEDWPAFLGRVTSSLDQLDRALIVHNGTRFERQAEETLAREKK